MLICSCQESLCIAFKNGSFFAAVLHKEKPLNDHCHMGVRWIIPVISLHAIYVATLIGFTGAIHHIEFRFQELKALWRGILVSTASIGISVYILLFIFIFIYFWYLCDILHTIIIYSMYVKIFKHMLNSIAFVF